MGVLLSDARPVARGRAVLGLAAGLIMVASSAAHSLMGWPRLAAMLAQVGAPANLVRGLGAGWHFAGVAILTYGCIALWLFADALRGRPVSLRPLVLIALSYTAFGAGAYVVSGRNSFYFIFIVPGLMLLAAAWGRGAARAQ